MNGPPLDLRTTCGGFASAWQAFFFSPVDARLCGLLRIGFALCVLINLACLYPDLERWFADAGVLSSETVYLLQPRERWSLLQWIPDGWLQVAFGIFALQALLLLAGVASRTNLLCVLVWLISFQNRNPLILTAEDIVLRLIGWYLLLVPVGAAWSVDAWRKGSAAVPKLVAAPGVKLLQLQMVVIFLTAGWFKLNGEPWRSGVALFFVAQLDDYFGRASLPAWVLETPWIVRGFTWSVIAIELLVPLAVWFKQTRRWALLLALVFHLGNELTMHLFLFHWIMLLGWCSFLLPEDFAFFGRKFTTEARRHGEEQGS